VRGLWFPGSRNSAWLAQRQRCRLWQHNPRPSEDRLRVACTALCRSSRMVPVDSTLPAGVLMGVAQGRWARRRSRCQRTPLSRPSPCRPTPITTTAPSLKVSLDAEGAMEMQGVG
jgi:hypothetical protein